MHRRVIGYPFQLLCSSYISGVHPLSIQVYEGQAEQAFQKPTTAGLEHDISQTTNTGMRLLNWQRSRLSHVVSVVRRPVV